MRRATTGFTLIEMMVTISIMAILLAIATPSFNNTIAGTRISGEINELQASLNFARSEAVKRGLKIDVCPPTVPNGTTCANTNPLNWSSGWVVLIDGTATQLRISPAVTHGDTLTSTSAAAIPYPQFTPAGYTFFAGAGTTIKLHDSNNTPGLYRCVVFNAGSWATQQGGSC